MLAKLVLSRIPHSSFEVICNSFLNEYFHDPDLKSKVITINGQILNTALDLSLLVIRAILPSFKLPWNQDKYF